MLPGARPLSNCCRRVFKLRAGRSERCLAAGRSVGLCTAGMAKILSIKGADKEAWHVVFARAAAVLAEGGVIALPTDTIYGIAASVNSSAGIDRLYSIKGRVRSRPIAICLSEVEQFDKWARVTVSDELLQALFPGAVTAVFERRPSLHPHLNPGNPLVGVRIPDHGFVRALVSHCGHPLALTSANVSDTRSTLAVEEFSELWPELGLVVDGGRIGEGGEEGEGEGEGSRSGSTVVDLSQEGRYSVIREGSCYQSTVEVLRKFNLTDTGTT